MGRILGHFHYDPYIAKMSKRIHTQNFLTVIHTQQENFDYKKGEREIPEYFYYIPHTAKIFWNFLLKIFLL